MKMWDWLRKKWSGGVSMEGRGGVCDQGEHQDMDHGVLEGRCVARADCEPTLVEHRPL